MKCPFINSTLMGCKITLASLFKKVDKTCLDAKKKKKKKKRKKENCP